MEVYKHDTDRMPPGRLPLFPEPYPGESFYSILCRYHVRSGNAGDWHTSKQLFGYNSSLTSTLITPFHLEMVKHWIPPSSGIDPGKMLRANTAFNIYGINATSSELECIRDVVNGQKAAASFPRWMHPRIINQAGHLRYCPECAAEQIKLYGEPYWQVLPQIDEVEYCPCHGTRIRNSPIQLGRIRFHYHPASSVLTAGSLDHSTNVGMEEWDSLFKIEKSFFTKISQNINWLYQNGHIYAGYGNLVRTYNRILGKRRHCSWFEISKQEVMYALTSISHGSQLYSYFKHKNSRQFGSGFLYLYSFRTCSHVMLMTALCGNPQLFYKQ